MVYKRLYSSHEMDDWVDRLVYSPCCTYVHCTLSTLTYHAILTSQSFTLPLSHRLVRHSLRLHNFRWIVLGHQGVARRRQTLKMFPMMVISLIRWSVPSQTHISRPDETYERQAAVCAHIDLRLIHIDEDLRMSQWASSTITSNYPLIRPADRLLVDQFNCRVWSRLSHKPISLLPVATNIHRYCPLFPRQSPPYSPTLTFSTLEKKDPPATP